MFNYTNPVGTGILEQQNALDEFRIFVDRQYTSAANNPGTHFVTLDRIPAGANPTPIPWPAFPVTAPATNEEIDAKRFDNQDEYVEWRVIRENNKVKRITFTTEFPEYYQALAEVSFEALVAGIRDAIPGADPTAEELFGAGFDPATASGSERWMRFRERSVVPFGSPAGVVPPNPWNNGTKGILCLGQQFNTMGALFGLATQCAVPNPGIPAEDQCAAVCQPGSCACGPNRSSDPQICTAAQSEARLPRFISLQDPVGVQIFQLNGTWRLNGNQIDINDPANNQGVWRVDRNGRRGVLEVSDTLTLNNSEIETGAQVSKELSVGALVLSAPENDLSDALIADAAEAGQRVSRLYRSLGPTS